MTTAFIPATRDNGTLALIARLETQLREAAKRGDRIAIIRLEQRIAALRGER